MAIFRRYFVFKQQRPCRDSAKHAAFSTFAYARFSGCRLVPFDGVPNTVEKHRIPREKRRKFVLSTVQEIKKDVIFPELVH